MNKRIYLIFLTHQKRRRGDNMNTDVAEALHGLSRVIKAVRYSQLLEKAEDERQNHGEEYAEPYKKLAQQFNETVDYY